VVTVTLVDDSLTAKWSTVAFSKIKDGVTEARKRATAALEELQEAVAE
jgi:hypothetical protein